MIKIKKLDLKNKEVRQKYSLNLQQFESEFNYPLGEKSFFIQHGADQNNDYFTFFEQMGNVHYLVAEDNGVVVGAGCAVLREINNENVWYLCDFKIKKEYRGKRILEKMTLKYFIPFYLKSKKMILVNMSHPDGNGLINKVKKIFKFLKLNIHELYFFEWNKKTFIKDKLKLEQFYIIHNKGKKDIVIDNESYHIYHLVNKDSDKDYSKFQLIDFNKIDNNDTIMLCSTMNPNIAELLKIKAPSTVGTILSCGINDQFFSSCEI